MVSQSLIAFDTDHIKRYVFGTSKLKEIRGASSILDYLNRQRTKEIAEGNFSATTIYAHGGSALFLIASDKAEQLGRAIQKLYYDETGGGASITYAIQRIPEYGSQDIMSTKRLDEHVSMAQVLKLLRLRLRQAKEDTRANGSEKSNFQEETAEDLVKEAIALPSHALLCTCNSCGIAYAEGTWRDLDDVDEPEGRYCRVCISKREEDKQIKIALSNRPKRNRATETLWGHILQTLITQDTPETSPYTLTATLNRPKDFNVFRDFTSGKGYLGLIYADANGMGRAIEELETLKEVQEFALKVDEAVFKALGDAIRKHLPMQNNTFPFDVLLVGGDDIVIVTPAEQALQVACALAEQFYAYTKEKYTLSVGVVLAPVKYPFNLQRQLVEDTIKAAKMSGAESNPDEEKSRINFVVVTGNTSLSYANISKQLYQEKNVPGNSEKFYATLRPYTLTELHWLLEQLRTGNEMHMGRTKLHQLREAILKLNNTGAVIESLMLLRNWKKQERDFIKQMVKECDTRLTSQQQQKGMLFPWYLDGGKSGQHESIYRTPLLDFVELYDLVSA